MSDTLTILILTAMGGAIAGMARLLWAERNARADAEKALAVANEQLEGYATRSPELIRRVDALLAVLPTVDLPPPMPARPHAPGRRRPRPRRRP